MLRIISKVAKRPVQSRLSRDETGRFIIITNYILLAPGTVHYLSSITVPFLCIGLPL